MTPERWQQVADLFEAALDRAPADRAAFLDEACHGDPDLRREVGSLVEAHGRAGGFLSAPAFDPPDAPAHSDAADSLEDRQIGPYRVERVLGYGGMGVVFLAEDTRLGRKVALKALPPAFAMDERRRERLRNEARAAAALSHPGIATVYALEQVGRDVFVAFEYVRGETLRAELDRGPLAHDRLLDTSRQLGRALSAAHASGIVHRDLKPENVMRCADGTIKVLDFGLARFENPDVETATLARLTASGTVLGTPAYMSPEQLEARPVDGRTDIFALGVMMYEMACGMHPYQGRTPASTIARIMNAEPAPLGERMPAALPGLEQIVDRCLRKDPAARYQSAVALVADLDRVASDSDDPVLPTRSHRGLRARPTGPERSRRTRPLAWWRIHQTSVMTLYSLMGIVMWTVKSWAPGAPGLLLFVAYVASAALNGTLRAHLLFTSRHNESEMRAELARTAALRFWSDWGIVGALAVAAMTAAGGHPAVAALLVAIAVGSAAAFTIIEPATTRAALQAFPDRE